MSDLAEQLGPTAGTTKFAKIAKLGGMSPKAATAADRASKAGVVAKEFAEPITQLERYPVLRERLSSNRTPGVTNIPMSAGGEMMVYEGATAKGRPVAVKIPRSSVVPGGLDKRIVAEAMLANKGLAPEFGAFQTSKGQYIVSDFVDTLPSNLNKLPLEQRAAIQNEVLDLTSKASLDNSLIPQDIHGSRGRTNLNPGSLKNVGRDSDKVLKVIDAGEFTLANPQAVLDAEDAVAKRVRSMESNTPQRIVESQAEKVAMESAEDLGKLKKLTKDQLDMEKYNLGDEQDFLKRISEPSMDLGPTQTSPITDSLAAERVSPHYMEMLKKRMGR
jgi:hypothetical protein